MWPVRGVLPPELEVQGFSVAEDEDFVYLLKHGTVLVSFLATKVTKEELEAAARECECYGSGKGSRSPRFGSQR